MPLQFGMNLAAELVVETAPGDHQGVITAHADFSRFRPFSLFA